MVALKRADGLYGFVNPHNIVSELSSKMYVALTIFQQDGGHGVDEKDPLVTCFYLACFLHFVWMKYEIDVTRLVKCWICDFIVYVVKLTATSDFQDGENGSMVREVRAVSLTLCSYIPGECQIDTRTTESSRLRRIRHQSQA